MYIQCGHPETVVFKVSSLVTSDNCQDKKKNLVKYAASAESYAYIMTFIETESYILLSIVA